ncbi:hypothetical protein BH09VER1_BH09VER1_51990 [soil metagenome]
MHQPDLLETPEWAIQAFEKLTGLRVAVHDLSASLWPFLQPERFRHRSACCVAVKARHDWACVDFEITRLHRDILDSPDGRFHTCHAGFMEWVLPVVINDRLAWILFAGQARATGPFQHLRHDIRRTSSKAPRSADLPGIDESRADIILEGLRQLRTRLLEWHGVASALSRHAPGAKSGPSKELADRRMLIQSILYRSHTSGGTLADLARALHLGESRTSHLVKELFGCSYVRLLNRLRLRTAARLLRESSLSIVEVCHGSGFQDLSHFHRSFQKRFSTTPLKYRRQSRA